MARVNGSPILISGKFGDKVFKVRNGKMYVSALPRKTKKRPSAKTLKRREKFTYLTRMAAAVKQLSPLSQLWSKTEPLKSEVAQKVFKRNYHLLTDEVFGSPLQLAPPETSSIEAEVISSEVTEEKISVRVRIPLENNIDPFYEPKILGCLMVSYLDPEEKGKERYKFLPLISDYYPTQQVEEMVFEFNFSPKQYNEFTSYTEKCMNFSLLTIGRNGQPISNSSIS